MGKEQKTNLKEVKKDHSFILDEKNIKKCFNEVFSVFFEEQCQEKGSGYTVVNKYSNVRLVLGVIAILMGLFCKWYPFPIPTTKEKQRIVCVIVYFLITGVLEFWIRFREHDAFACFKINGKEILLSGGVEPLSANYTMDVYVDGVKTRLSTEITKYVTVQDKILDEALIVWINEEIGKLIKQE
ncbi:hypothetical protein PCE1_000155 [Barthelona sp. PCE]